MYGVRPLEKDSERAQLGEMKAWSYQPCPLFGMLAVEWMLVFAIQCASMPTS